MPSDTCPTCGDTAEWCAEYRARLAAEAAERMNRSTSASLALERTRPRRKRTSKAQALVDEGLADSLADARAQLRDMSW